MFSFFNKKRILALAAILSLNTMSSFAMPWDNCCEPCDPCPCNRLYIGAFGGGLYSDSTRVYQMGTAFFDEAAGGPLAVDARGSTKRTSTGFGGVQVGYEWAACPLNIGCGGNWGLAPAFELEAFWFSNRRRGDLINPTIRLPEHDFRDSFKLDTGVYLANFVLSFANSSCYGITPYVGIGVGAARVELSHADSFQIAPVEAGVNHFNSKRSDTTWAFASQVKAGLRYQFWNCLSIFGEYRYLVVNSTDYILGSTAYISPPHAPTSPWNVKVKNIQSNAFVFGLRYDI